MLHVTCEMWQVTCNTWHVTCDMRHVTCGMYSRVFLIFLLIFLFFLCNNDKFKCQIPPSEVEKPSNIQMVFIVFSSFIFLFSYGEKNHNGVFSSKVNEKKNWWLKKTKVSDQIVEQFCFFVMRPFLNCQFLFIFLLFIVNIGSYDSLLLHCGGGGGTIPKMQ